MQKHEANIVINQAEETGLTISGLPDELSPLYISRIGRGRFLQLAAAGILAAGAMIGNSTEVNAQQHPYNTQQFKELLAENSVNLQQTDVPNHAHQTNLGQLLLEHNIENKSGSLQMALNPDLYPVLESTGAPVRRPTIAYTLPIMLAEFDLLIGATKTEIYSQQRATFGFFAALGTPENGFYQVLQSRNFDLPTAQKINLIHLAWKPFKSALPGPEFVFGGGYDKEMKDQRIFPNAPIILPQGVRPPSN